MSVFYVFQGINYEKEHAGQYVWSSQLDKAGHKNAGYTMMTNVKAGDFILHNTNGKIVAISIAQRDCYGAERPEKLLEADTSVAWNNDGYRVDTTYYEFDKPLITSNYKEWLVKHYVEGSAFTRKGSGKQQYMCNLVYEHAIFLLEKAIELQKDNDVLANLKNALSDIIRDKESEYDQAEKIAINEAVENASSHEKPEWSGKREKQAMSISYLTGRAVPKRDAQRAADALEYANYMCEYEEGDRTFLRKNEKPYTEPHHLIPISKYRDFEYSVDVMENIVSLCSHCHNLLHYGRFEDRVPILSRLYNERIGALKSCGLNLTLDKLKSYYR